MPKQTHHVLVDDALSVTASVTAVVSKDIRVAIKGYSAAVERLRQAVPNAREEPDDVYIGLFEAAGWLATIATLTNLGENDDARAVIFARHRSQHHLASITYFDEARGAQLWRPETQLPSDPRHENAKLKRIYRDRLANKPVLEVFDRIGPVIAALGS
jgi:hypothetical protein